MRDFLINKKFMIITIFLVGLITISAVGATENVENPLVSSDDDNLDELMMDEDESPSDNGDNSENGNDSKNENYLKSETEPVYGDDNSNENDDDSEIHAILSMNTTEIKRGDYIYVTAVNEKTNAPLANITVGVMMGDDTFKAITNSQGIGSFRFLGTPGEYDVIVALWKNNNTISNYVNGISCNMIENATINVLPIDVHFKITKSGAYFGDTILNFLVYYDGGFLPDEPIYVEFSNGKTVMLHTDAQGKATYSIPFSPGKYSLTAYLEDEDDVDPVNLTNFKIYKAPGKITAPALSTVYGSGKNFKVALINTATKMPIANVKINLNVFTGKKYKTVTLRTNSKGIAELPITKYSIGSHKVIVSIKDTANVKAASTKSSIKIAKATLAVYAPKVTNCYRQNEYFQVTVKNKYSKAPVSGIKVFINVYTGKKFVTLTAKTNSKGVASFSTKSLSKASHKVIVNIKETTNFRKASAKSTITVAKFKYSTKITIQDASTVDLGYYHIKFTLKDSKNRVLANKKVRLLTEINMFGLEGYTTENVLTTNSKGVVDTTLNVVVGGREVSLVARTIFDGDSLYKSSKAWTAVS